jgi:DNA integrity scanning protein DisA with diadenylate cyclase activity
MRAAPELSVDVTLHALELAVHWLSPSRIGATIVLFEDEIPWAALDTATATRAPALSIVNRRHFPALFAALLQRDLATIVDADGAVRKVGVGLRFSADADASVAADRGMRHRSAQRFTYDHPTATAIVVSEDGPVTVFREGVAVS